MRPWVICLSPTDRAPAMLDHVVATIVARCRNMGVAPVGVLTIEPDPPGRLWVRFAQGALEADAAA